MKDTKTKLSRATVALHWLVGGVMIVMLAVGMVMEKFELYFLYDHHKSVGIIAVAFILWRIVWRLQNGWLVPTIQSPRWQRIAAHLSHWVLISGTLLMPVSGITMSAGGGHGLAVFGLELLPATVNAAGEAVALNETLAGFASGVHHWCGRILIAFVVLHIFAALWHHFVHQDNVLRRMLAR